MKSITPLRREDPSLDSPKIILISRTLYKIYKKMLNNSKFIIINHSKRSMQVNYRKALH